MQGIAAGRKDGNVIEGTMMTKYHAQEYDLTVKKIVAEVGLTIVSELLGIEVLDHEILSLELITVEKRELDQIHKIKTPDGEFILNLEIQSSNDQNMAQRMLEYLAKAHRQHALPVISVVLYLGAEPMRMPHEITFETRWCTLQFRYTIITLNELSPSHFLNRAEPDYFILAVLASMDPPRELLRAILQKLLDSVPSHHIEDYILKLDVLCQLRGVEDVLDEEVRTLPVKVELKRLVTYKLGKEDGLKEGLKEGLEKGLRSSIMKILTKRFSMDVNTQREVQERLAVITDLKSLHELEDLALSVESLTEFQQGLPRQRS